MPSYVVTGASKGIGFEFVNQLSADIANTVFAIADITNPKALKVAAEVSKATGGKLDYLINNAGKTNHPGFTIDGFPSPEAVEHDMIDNVRPAHTVRTQHLILISGGSAKRVLTLSSALADLDATLLSEAIGEVSYSISKAALNMVVAKYAAQYKSEGFVFLAICPGAVETTMLSTGDDPEAKMSAAAIGKIAPPDFKGPISPAESVRMQLEVLNRWTVKDTGAFVSHFGTKQWF
ncbi:hypothetical protein C8R47DRAFT_1285282 [Mycena vitilis]|nr:hypothetical protein C8R47DRAFT_1285282 [Mycena vitilis]